MQKWHAADAFHVVKARRLVGAHDGEKKVATKEVVMAVILFRVVQFCIRTYFVFNVFFLL